MRAPDLRARIQRRILVNYRVDPNVVAALLPTPFRPAIVDGYGVAGICLIRLGEVRPVGVPTAFGITSENAAHRVAVEWDTSTGPVTGVYIPRRDTSSRIAAFSGGRFFPGRQHRAQFHVDEQDDRYRIELESLDGDVAIAVAAHVAGSVMPGSIFDSVEAASRFFRDAPVGYAATPCAGVFDGVELGTDGWDMSPLHLDEIASSFFDDRDRFPRGTAVADSAFLMANVTTRWRPQPKLVASARAHERGAVTPDLHSQ